VHERVVRVWDLPTRAFHWTLVVLVVAAVTTAKLGGNWMQWHGRIGQLLVALLAFRILWGLFGSTTARFGHFLRGPRAILIDLGGRWHGVGHSPVGGWAVIVLLAVVGAQALTGLFANDAIAFRGPLYPLAGADLSDLSTTWHRRLENALYAVVALHLLAILYYRLRRGRDLVTPMLTGRRRMRTLGQDTMGGGWLPFVWAVGIAAAVFWVADGGLLPPPPPPAPDLGW
jgi:cytochrome b